MRCPVLNVATAMVGSEAALLWHVLNLLASTVPFGFNIDVVHLTEFQYFYPVPRHTDKTHIIYPNLLSPHPPISKPITDPKIS